MFKKINTIAATCNTAINNFVSEHRRAVTGFFTFAILFLTTVAAHAITAPTTGSFAYDVYDIGINNIMGGPIGFVLGAGCMGLGGFAAVKQNIPMAIGAVLGGAAILKCDSLVTSLGMLM